MKPSFETGYKFLCDINGLESIIEVEYVTNLPLGTKYTAEYMYVCRTFGLNDGGSYYYRLIQERDLNTYQKI